jgi:hypothetical protein
VCDMSADRRHRFTASAYQQIRNELLVRVRFVRLNSKRSSPKGIFWLAPVASVRVALTRKQAIRMKQLMAT